MGNYVKCDKEILKSLKGNSLTLWLMLSDRASLSEKNGWIDKESGCTYVIMTVKEICEKLEVCKRTAASILNHLETAKLIRRKRQGLCRPQRILIMPQNTHIFYKDSINDYHDKNNTHNDISLKINKNNEVYTDDRDNDICDMHNETTADDFYIEWWEQMSHIYDDVNTGSSSQQVSPASVQASMPAETLPETEQPEEQPEKDASGEDNKSLNKLHHQKGKKLHFRRCNFLHPNNNKYNNTSDSYIYNISNLSYSDDYKILKSTFLKNIEAEIISDRISESLISIMADTTADMLAKKNSKIYVSGALRDYQDVYRHLMSLDSSHVEYIAECINATTVSIRNPRAYMLACMYNASETIDAYYETQAVIDMNKQTAGIA